MGAVVHHDCPRHRLDHERVQVVYPDNIVRVSEVGNSSFEFDSPDGPAHVIAEKHVPVIPRNAAGAI